MADVDKGFYDRADAHIHLSNDQISEDVTRGKVSASMMYANARFSAWVSAIPCQSGEEMMQDREKAVGYFVEQFRIMLEENYDDYATNFDRYMRPNEPLSDNRS